MNQSTRAITLVLISAGSILAAHHAFDTLRQGYNNLDAESDTWTAGSPTTRRSGGSYYGGHSHYYYSSGSRSSGGSWSSGSSSGSSSAHGSSFGGFGGTAHGSAS
jgi:hypothetical protein